MDNLCSSIANEVIEWSKNVKIMKKKRIKECKNKM